MKWRSIRFINMFAVKQHHHHAPYVKKRWWRSNRKKCDDEHDRFVAWRLLPSIQVTSDISIDSRHQTLQGLMFPFDENVIEALHLFKSEKVDYLQLVNIESRTEYWGGRDHREERAKTIKSSLTTVFWIRWRCLKFKVYWSFVLLKGNESERLR